MRDTGGGFSTDELVAYCRTQAGLLHGRVETLEEETASLLSDIDAELADARAQLDEYDGLARAQSPAGPDLGAGEELADIESLEADLTEKQAVAKAKQTRRDAFEAVAVGYLELADQLAAETPAPAEAIKRVLAFEHERDAPTYFDDRVTMLEAATEGGDSD